MGLLMSHLTVELSLPITDINECLNSSLHNCHADATCQDTDGSFNCECNKGFNGSGVECLSEITLVMKISHTITHDYHVRY